MFQQIFTEDAGAHSEEGNIKEDKRLRGFFHMVDKMKKKQRGGGTPRKKCFLLLK